MTEPLRLFVVHIIPSQVVSKKSTHAAKVSESENSEVRNFCVFVVHILN